MRKHLIKNIIQHYETLKQFQNRQEEYDAYLEWFKTLPLFYETDDFRAVHACWDYKSISFLKQHLQNDRLTHDLIVESANKGSELYEAIEHTLKGKEIRLPEGKSFKDKDGAERTDIRIKWWEDPSNTSYKEISVENILDLPEAAIDLTHLKNKDYYREDDRCVFFGHYWLKDKPSLYRNNICCLDYSVAKDGYLVAYSFDGERELDKNKFTYVKAGRE